MRGKMILVVGLMLTTSIGYAHAKSSKSYFVYETTNKVNGMKYIGKHYGYRNDGYLGSGPGIKDAISKYGSKNFTRKIVSVHYTSCGMAIAEAAIISNRNAVESPKYYNRIGGMSGNIIKCMTLFGLMSPSLRAMLKISTISAVIIVGSYVAIKCRSNDKLIPDSICKPLNKASDHVKSVWKSATKGLKYKFYKKCMKSNMDLDIGC